METLVKVLIVEDEHYYKNLIRRFFNNSSHDFEITFSGSIENATILLDSSEFDLLISDIMLPDGNAFDVLEHVQGKEQRLPVIFLTSRGNEELAVKAFKCGVMDYLVKSPEVLKELPTTSLRVLHEWKIRTGHKEAERKLRESEHNYRVLVENISDVVWIIDPAFSRYTFVCPSVEIFLGYKPEEFLLLPIKQTLTYESGKLVESLKARTSKQFHEGKEYIGRGSFEIELEFVHKDGSFRWGALKGSLIFDDSKVVGLGGVTRDITDKKIAEAKNQELHELRHKMKVSERVSRIKEQFLANISHEIRTPMTGIMGMTDLLMKTPLNDNQKFYLSTIKTSSASLLAVVNQIMEIARLKAGKSELNLKVFDLEEHGKLTLSLFSALMEHKGLSRTFHFDTSIPRLVKADEYRLGQIITNLLSNAIKFTSKGFIEISYSLQEKVDNKLMIRIEVSDSGIGITKENQNRLFELFSQIDTSDTRSHDGIGLGLSLSQHYARMMGGKIGLRSTPGEGSHFWLDFQAEEAEEKFDASSVKHEEKPLSKCNGKVLLVEDKKTNQLVVTLMLREAGCQVDVAMHGQEALEKFVPGKYKLILMDIQMPVMDGLTATKELHKRYSKEQLPPIVGLSAKALRGDAEHYISEGMDDYLTKPVSSDMLIKKILKWVLNE